MTIEEARRIRDCYDDSTKNTTDEDLFLFTEAMDLLIRTEHDPRDMMYLGGVYYEEKYFDLALKYYEMAAELDYDEAYECLGYIWYYGRTGERNFEKAFKYFSIMMNKGSLVAAYKVADMYKNGYFVEKDRAKYAQIVEELFQKASSCTNVFDPVPEIYTRLAGIRKDQGNTDEAVELYLKAKDWLAQRIRYNAFFGNLNIMKWMIDELYELIEFDPEWFDFYDLYYLLKKPCSLSFEYNGKKHVVNAVEDGGECNVSLDGKWFRTRDDFFYKGEIDGVKMTAVYDDLYDFELM